MLTNTNFLNKLDKPNKRLIITVVLLPTGGLETLTNYEDLENKAKYLKSAYDENLKLKNTPKGVDIYLIDVIVVCEDDVKKVVDKHQESVI